MRSDATTTPFLHLGWLILIELFRCQMYRAQRWWIPLTVLCIPFNTDCLGSPVHFRARQGSCLFTDQAIASMPSKGSLSFDPSAWNFLIPPKIVFGTKFPKKKTFSFIVWSIVTLSSPLSPFYYQKIIQIVLPGRRLRVISKKFNPQNTYQCLIWFPNIRCSKNIELFLSQRNILPHIMILSQRNIVPHIMILSMLCE